MGAVDRSRLLDVHSDADHGRTVLTIAGEATGLEHDLLALGMACVERLDLRLHEGVHPRTGVLDVVPFVAQGSDRSEAASAAISFGRSFNEATGTSVVFYEAASPDHRSLPAARKAIAAGGKPDLGASVDPRVGVTMVGARGPLVAYNVVLDSDDLAKGRAIASRLRAIPGIRALAFHLPSRVKVQVSMNLVDPDRASMVVAYRAVKEGAGQLGIEVVGAEVVGLATRASTEGRTPEDYGMGSEPKILEDLVP